MEQNTFEPCKDHENGHFNWCLLCEIDNLRNRNNDLVANIRSLIFKIECDSPKEKTTTVHEIVNGWCKPDDGRGEEWKKQEEEFSQNW